MKNSMVSLLSVLMIALTFVSCSKETVNGPDPDVLDGNDEFFFICKVDGQLFKITGDLRAYGVNDDDSYSMYGNEWDGENFGRTIYVSVDKNLGEGTHLFGGNNTFALISDPNGGAYATYWGAGSGQVTIEERTATMVRGTFSFKATNSEDESIVAEVTEGKFNVKFRD